MSGKAPQKPHITRAGGLAGMWVAVYGDPQTGAAHRAQRQALLFAERLNNVKL